MGTVFAVDSPLGPGEPTGLGPGVCVKPRWTLSFGAVVGPGLGTPAEGLGTGIGAAVAAAAAARAGAMVAGAGAGVDGT